MFLPLPVFVSGVVVSLEALPFPLPFPLVTGVEEKGISLANLIIHTMTKAEFQKFTIR